MLTLLLVALPFAGVADKALPVAASEERQPLPDNHPSQAADDSAQRVAGLASEAGSLLSQTSGGQAVSALARSLATAQAGSQLQQWLSRFGTARVQLSDNQRFSLRDSRLDLLLPWWERNDALLFSQSSLHRSDQRSQANIGVGWRWFSRQQMTGINTFFDYDLSQSHARLGVGLEYWRDFMQLGVNGYRRLSSWRQSGNIGDYQARPADGWDIRLRGWLPQWPQWGATLSYEKYVGGEIGLDNSDRRRRNPSAFNAGLTYTPFPLLTLKAIRRLGVSQRDDTRFALEFRYQLGVPWRQQISRDAVSALRTLAGSRYQLVERNDNIVLAYRKQRLLRLNAVAQITGYGGQQKPLDLVVNSRYPLQHIDWSAAELLQAGGQILRHGVSNYSVILPDWQPGPGATNSWLISMRATDSRGNVSDPAITRVTVTQAAISSRFSTLFPDRVQLHADGSSHQQLLLKVRDSRGQPVDVPAAEIRWQILAGSSHSARVTEFSRRTDGEYIATLTAGTRPEQFTLQPLVRNQRLAAVSVSITADDIHAQISRFSSDRQTLTADRKQRAKLYLQVTDGNGNPLRNVAVKLSHPPQVVITKPGGKTNAEGIYRTELLALQAGKILITARLANGAEKTLALVASRQIVQLAEVGVNGSHQAQADGVAQIHLRAQVRDNNGNTQLPGVAVGWQTTLGKLSTQLSRTDGDGVAQVTLTSTRAGEAQVSAVVDGKRMSADKQIIFTPVKEPASWRLSELQANKTHLTAGDEAGVLYRVSVTDSQGNALPGVLVSWQLAGEAESHPATSRSDSQGIAVIRVKSQRVGQLIMTARLDGQHALTASPVTVTAAGVSVTRSEFRSDKTLIIADGSEYATLYLRLWDQFGNPISDKKISISVAENLAGLILSPVLEQSNGRYSARVRSTAKGQVTLLARVDGQILRQRVTLTVGATRPALHFPLAVQRVSWTRHFSASQTASGIPAGVEQRWSSSDPQVARVDNRGQVTLLAAGRTQITLQTAGNDDSAPAESHYLLMVERADPQLVIGNQLPITARWGEGKTWKINAMLENRDTTGQLTPRYHSENPDIVSVSSGGELAAKKPGSARLVVSTPQTGQFNAASADVTWVMEKGVVDIGFKQARESIAARDTFRLQPTLAALPPDTSIKWESSDPQVIGLSPGGEVQGGLSAGRSRLTLTVQANEYYQSSSGSYELVVYGAPILVPGKISFRSRGNSSSSSVWTPVFTDDELSVNWRLDNSNLFSGGHKVTLYLKDSHGNILAQEEESNPSGSHTTHLKPQASFWGKQVVVELVAEGHLQMTSSKKFRPFAVRNLSPEKIWNKLFLKSKIETYSRAGKDSSCQESYLGREHWNQLMVDGGNISFSGKKLLAPLTLSARARLSHNKNHSVRTFYQHHTIDGDCTFDFGSIRATEQCWSSDIGGYVLLLDVEYNGQTFTYSGHHSWGWGGNGDGMGVVRRDAF